jgi:hypothetical protein
LPASETTKLDNFAAYLLANPTLTAEVAGHTDPTGGDASNLVLSQNRARAVADYLTGLGVAAERLHVVGYGESRPIGTNDAMNRRVDLIAFSSDNPHWNTIAFGSLVAAKGDGATVQTAGNRLYYSAEYFKHFTVASQVAMLVPAESPTSGLQLDFTNVSPGTVTTGLQTVELADFGRIELSGPGPNWSELGFVNSAGPDGFPFTDDDVSSFITIAGTDNNDGVYNVIAIAPGGTQLLVGPSRPIDLGPPLRDETVMAGQAGVVITNYATALPALEINNTRTGAISGPVLNFDPVKMSRVSLNFVDNLSAPDQIIRSEGSWGADVFGPGDQLVITGSASNDNSSSTPYTIDTVNTAPIRAQMAGAPDLTFADNGPGIPDEIIRSTGDWLAEGFRVNQRIEVTNSNNNDLTFTISRINVEKITVALSRRPGPRLVLLDMGAAPDIIVRAHGSWVADGFRVGQTITIAGSTLTGTMNNDGTYTIADINRNPLVVGPDTLAPGTVITLIAADSIDTEIAQPGVVRITGTFAPGTVITLAPTEHVNEEINTAGVDVEGSFAADTVITLIPTDSLVQEFGATDVSVRKASGRVMSHTAGLDFLNNGPGTPDQIIRSYGSWIEDGFVPGTQLTISGAAPALNRVVRLSPGVWTSGTSSLNAVGIAPIVLDGSVTVDTVDDTLTFSSAHGLADGTLVTYLTDIAPGGDLSGLRDGAIYKVTAINASTIKLTAEADQHNNRKTYVIDTINVDTVIIDGIHFDPGTVIALRPKDKVIGEIPDVDAEIANKVRVSANIIRSAYTSATLSFESNAGPDQIIRSEGNWTTDGFVAGDVLLISGSVRNGSPSVPYTIDNINDAPVTIGTVTYEAGRVITLPAGVNVAAEVGANVWVTTGSVDFIAAGFGAKQQLAIENSSKNDNQPGARDAIRHLTRNVLTLSTPVVAEGRATGKTPADPYTLNGSFNLTNTSKFDPYMQFVQQYALNQIKAQLTGDPDVSFDPNGALPDRILRNAGSWIQDGFVEGQQIIVEFGSTLLGATGNNNRSFTIESINTAPVVVGADTYDPGTILTLAVSDAVLSEAAHNGFVIRGAERILIGTGDDPNTKEKSGYLYESFDGGATLHLLNGSPVPVTEGNTFGIPGGALVGNVNAVVYGGREPDGSGGFNPMPDIGYVGTDGNSAGDYVFVRQSTGADFRAIKSYSWKGGSEVRDIASNPDDWREVYVLDSNSQVWFADITGRNINLRDSTDDSHVKWENWTHRLGDLPGGDMLSTIEVIQVAGQQVVLVGGQGGVYRLIGGNDWTEFGVGLPNSLVTDIDFSSLTDTLLVGTLGRGAWQITNASHFLAVQTALEFTGSNTEDILSLERGQDRPWELHLYQYYGATKPRTPTLSLPYAAIASIALNSGGGDDNITLNYSNGVLGIGGDIVIDGGAETVADTMTIEGRVNEYQTTPPVGVTRRISVVDAWGHSGSESRLWMIAASLWCLR